MSQNILVIDDSEDVQIAVQTSLSSLELSLKTANSLKDGIEKATAEKFSLIVIDIGLPDGDGFELFKQLRNLPNNKKTPVIFLTGDEDVNSKISAFSLGADDYIVKPFNTLELRARVERRLKKHMEDALNGDHITAGPLVLEVSSQRLKIQGKKGYVSLTPREFKILLLLVKNPERIFTREFILNKIWGRDVFVTDRTVDAHICYLRKKLNKFSTYVQSVPGEGYRFNPNPPVVPEKVS